MKRLTLIRHAQADSQLPDQSDWERPLTKRGAMDAADMSRRLKSQRLRPDFILCSPALRTRQTADIFAKCFGLFTDKLSFPDDLYLADTKHLLSCVQVADDAHQHVIVIAHNPGVTEFAQWLAQDRCVDAMPTCAIFTAEFTIKHWRDLVAASGTNEVLDYPQRIG